MSRIFISRMAVTSSIGCDVGEFWQNLLQGRSGARPAEMGSVHLFSEDIGLPPSGDADYFGEWRAIAETLIGGAGVDKPVDGVIWASGQQGFKFGDALNVDRSKQLTSDKVRAHLNRVLPGAGSVINHANGCVTGLSALDEARVRIAGAGWRRALVIVAEARVRDWVLWPYYKMGLLSKTTTRPFAKDRDGFVKGEGAALILLEEESVLSGDPYCELLDVKTWPGRDKIFAPPADPARDAGMLRTISPPESIDYINLYGSGSRASDDMEIKTAAAYLGASAAKVPVSAMKGYFGHLNTAAAALELVATALMIKHQTVIPTLHLTREDNDGPLNFTVGAPLKTPINRALKLAFGFGWSSSAALLSKA